jgi:hypothetical protein
MIERKKEKENKKISPSSAMTTPFNDPLKFSTAAM